MCLYSLVPNNIFFLLLYFTEELFFFIWLSLSLSLSLPLPSSLSQSHFPLLPPCFEPMPDFLVGSVFFCAISQWEPSALCLPCSISANLCGLKPGHILYTRKLKLLGGSECKNICSVGTWDWLNLLVESDLCHSRIIFDQG